jgi:hypothetical protein
MKEKLQRLTGLRHAGAAIASPFDHNVNSTSRNCSRMGLERFEKEELREKEHKR